MPLDRRRREDAGVDPRHGVAGRLRESAGIDRTAGSEVVDSPAGAQEAVFGGRTIQRMEPYGKQGGQTVDPVARSPMSARVSAAKTTALRRSMSGIEVMERFLEATIVAALLACGAATLAITASAHRAVAQTSTAGVDRALLASTAESVGHVIREEYFDETIAANVEAALTGASARARYAAANSPDALAQMLTRDLYELTRDKHLAVTVKRPPTAGPTDAGSISPLRNQPTNAGFNRVETLPANIGYLDLRMFLRPIEHRDALAAAMRTLNDASALILDMRGNGGGSPGTVALLLSYLFDEPDLPLFDVIPRRGDRETYATEPASTRLERDGVRPVWVLTSARTFSAGEGLAFLLQERGRAQVIGERTAGAANPGRPYPVNALFEVTVPNAQIRSAVRQSNWEGTGVIPDVSAPASTALDVALERARQYLRDRKAP